MLRSRAAVLAGLVLGLSLTTFARAAEGKYPPQPIPEASRQAKENSTAARRELAKAQSALQNAVSKLKADFEASSEYQAATGELKKAQAEFDAARKQVIAGLEQSPSYKQAAATAKKTADSVDALRANGGSIDEISEAARTAMEAGTAASKLEGEAIAKDPKATEARTRMIEANNKVLALRKQFDKSIKDSPSWQQGKQDIQSAEQNVAAADKSLKEAEQQDGQAFREWQEKCAEIDRKAEAERRARYNDRRYSDWRRRNPVGPVPPKK